MTVKHTAHHTEGQIYIPEVNALLAVGCLLLVITFRESVRLAAAYGIAVTGTMAITSILFYVVARHHWNWSKWKAGAVLALFLCIDIPFLAANLFKFFDGGYVPMLIGAFLIAGMLILDARPNLPASRALNLLSHLRSCTSRDGSVSSRPSARHRPI